MKYITVTHSNTYTIQRTFNKKCKNYGSFPTLEEAKAYLEKVIENDWDEKLLAKNNQKELYPLRYIYKDKSGSYAVLKKINGKMERFGTFKRLEDAINERDLLIKYDWDFELLCEYGNTELFEMEE